MNSVSLLSPSSEMDSLGIAAEREALCLVGILDLLVNGGDGPPSLLKEPSGKNAPSEARDLLQQQRTAKT